MRKGCKDFWNGNKSKRGELSVIRKEAKRWLKALKIAKIIFEDQGYHTAYIEAMEKFIRRRLMYSPKISKKYIPVLHRISESKGVRMTHLVSQIIKDYLDRSGTVYDRKSETDSSEHSREV